MIHNTILFCSQFPFLLSVNSMLEPPLHIYSALLLPLRDRFLMISSQIPWLLIFIVWFFLRRRISMIIFLSLCNSSIWWLHFPIVTSDAMLAWPLKPAWDSNHCINRTLYSQNNFAKTDTMLSKLSSFYYVCLVTCILSNRVNFSHHSLWAMNI